MNNLDPLDPLDALSAGGMHVRRLCHEHFEQYVRDYGEDGEARETTDGSCHDCERHPPGCVCVDCAGGELTTDND